MLNKTIEETAEATMVNCLTFFFKFSQIKDEGQWRGTIKQFIAYDILFKQSLSFSLDIVKLFKHQYYQHDKCLPWVSHESTENIINLVNFWTYVLMLSSGIIWKLEALIMRYSQKEECISFVFYCFENLPIAITMEPLVLFKWGFQQNVPLLMRTSIK